VISKECFRLVDELWVQVNEAHEKSDEGEMPSELAAQICRKACLEFVHSHMMMDTPRFFNGRWYFPARWNLEENE
jgi:hypothetical protein